MNSENKGIILKNISFYYERYKCHEQHLFKDVSMMLKPSSLSLITGDSGTGKSTLIHLLLCLIRPVKGEIISDGVPVSRLRPPHQESWRKKVGMIFQRPYLMADMSVIENVMVSLIPRKMKFSEVVDRSWRMLEALKLSNKANRKIYEMSGGETQRVMIARALAADPPFIFADEPTASQDDEMTDLIFSLLSSCALRGSLVLIASHDKRIQSKEINRRFHLSENHVREIHAASSFDA